MGKKTVFSKGVRKGLGKYDEFAKFIGLMKTVEEHKQLKKDIKKVLQVANRRAQNIENAGLISPALRELEAERGKQGYSKFSITGLDLYNPSDWARAKQELSRAVSFINNPTSTSTGARQYIKQFSERINVPFEIGNKILEQVTRPDIDSMGNVAIFKYREIEEKLSQSLVENNDYLGMTQEEYIKKIESKINEEITLVENNSRMGVLDFQNQFYNPSSRIK